MKKRLSQKWNNSLVEQDFAKILTVSKSRGPPASLATKISAIAPETASQIDFEVEKKRKTVQIETADDVIAISHHTHWRESSRRQQPDVTIGTPKFGLELEISRF